ncbi:hypothetical protein HDU83_006482 [Entophlyctis luteolus]|nr:hypothetical protein HDU83_006482 [Entophlyctis luteolus]
MSLPAARFRRAAVMYIPGSDARKVAKALALPAVDTRVLDLEDSVALHRKDDARETVFRALESVARPPPVTGAAFRPQETCVRINSPSTPIGLRDLSAILPSAAVDSIMVPKATPSCIETVCAKIAQSAANKDIKILAAIESARGMLDIPKIIAAGDGRVEALVFAAEDYAADLGLIRTSSRLEMLLARQTVVMHAVANGLQAIDLNQDVLLEECREGRTFGFTGKQAIHPNQIENIQSTFTPTDKEIEYAARIVDAAREHSNRGVGAFDLDGKVPVILWARRILEKANK